VTAYASVDDLAEAALNLQVAIPSDQEQQEHLLELASRDIDSWLGASYQDAAIYAELSEQQRTGLRQACVAESIWRNAQGWQSWLGVADDVSSAGSISFFRPDPRVVVRYSPAMPELLSGLGLGARGAGLCASPSVWRFDPLEEEYAAPELNGGDASP
jgi:hypothetical protein